MNKYLVSLGKNSSSLKKVLISLPNGIYDLKLQASEGMLLDRASYMYTFVRGLKDLINSSIVVVSVKNEQKGRPAGIKIVSNKSIEQMPEEVRTPSIAKEQPSEAVVEIKLEAEQTETEAVVEDVSVEEQPKKKSKKKK